MKINPNGKINYFLKLVKNYPRWYLIVASRLIGKPLKKIQIANGITILGGDKSLIVDLIDEVFISETYNPDNMRILPGDVVIDVGANIGVFSLYASKMGARKIYSIEPLPESRLIISCNFRINNFPEPTIIAKALSDKEGSDKLYLGDIDSHSLLFDHNHKEQLHEYVKVRTETLRNIIQKYKITKVDFLKIDCEGSEGQIISSLPRNLWNIINKVAIEYHNPVSTMSHTEIAKYLKGVGYQIKIKQNDSMFGYIYAWKDIQY